MATENQFLAGLAGGADSRAHRAKRLRLTMAAGATVQDTITVPDGSWLSAVRFETPTAFTGSPTAINARVGSAAAGQQVVADVDVKAQGHVAATTVAAFDAVTGLSTYYVQIAASGGTNPAGFVDVILSYYAPTA